MQYNNCFCKWETLKQWFSKVSRMTGRAGALRLTLYSWAFCNDVARESTMIYLHTCQTGIMPGYAHSDRAASEDTLCSMLAHAVQRPGCMASFPLCAGCQRDCPSCMGSLSLAEKDTSIRGHEGSSSHVRPLPHMLSRTRAMIKPDLAPETRLRRSGRSGIWSNPHDKHSKGALCQIRSEVVLGVILIFLQHPSLHAIQKLLERDLACACSASSAEREGGCLPWPRKSTDGAND